MFPFIWVDKGNEGAKLGKERLMAQGGARSAQKIQGSDKMLQNNAIERSKGRAEEYLNKTYRNIQGSVGC